MIASLNGQLPLVGQVVEGLLAGIRVPIPTGLIVIVALVVGTGGLVVVYWVFAGIAQAIQHLIQQGQLKRGFACVDRLADTAVPRIMEAMLEPEGAQRIEQIYKEYDVSTPLLQKWLSTCCAGAIKAVLVNPDDQSAAISALIAQGLPKKTASSLAVHALRVLDEQRAAIYVGSLMASFERAIAGLMKGSNQDQLCIELKDCGVEDPGMQRAILSASNIVLSEVMEDNSDACAERLVVKLSTSGLNEAVGRALVMSVRSTVAKVKAERS